MRMIFLALLISCGGPSEVILEPQTPRPPAASAAPDANQSLQFLLDAWVLARDSIPIATPVSFDTFEERGILGVCITWTDKITGDITKEIRIDRESFQGYLEAGTIAPKVIIFHELAHCELDRDHTEDLARVDGVVIPFSYMFPSLWIDVTVYSTNEAHYLDELFGGNGFFERIPGNSSNNIIMLIDEPGRTGTAVVN